MLARDLPSALRYPPEDDGEETCFSRSPGSASARHRQRSRCGAATARGRCEHDIRNQLYTTWTRGDANVTMRGNAYRAVDVEKLEDHPSQDQHGQGSAELHRAGAAEGRPRRGQVWRPRSRDLVSTVWKLAVKPHRRTKA